MYSVCRSGFSIKMALDAPRVFKTYRAAEDYIKYYEKQTCAAFSKWHMRNHGMEHLTTLVNHRIWWTDARGEIPISYDGTPFVSIQSEVRQCHQGQEKKKRQQVSTTDHAYRTSRARIQHTKKLQCPAKIRMRMVVRFPEYQIDGEPTEWKMRMASKKLREHFTENTVQEFRVLVQINGEHKGHLVGELSGYGLPLHAEVKATMKELVDDGITKVSEIERHLHRDNGDVPLTNRRFFPLPQDIRNHVSQALKKKRLAYVYLLHVLVTEGLAAILQHCTGLSYKEADEECRAVEGSSDIQALKAGIIMSAEKKKQLEEKSKHMKGF